MPLAREHPHCFVISNTEYNAPEFYLGIWSQAFRWEAWGHNQRVWGAGATLRNSPKHAHQSFEESVKLKRWSSIAKSIKNIIPILVAKLKPFETFTNQLPDYFCRKASLVPWLSGIASNWDPFSHANIVVSRCQVVRRAFHWWVLTRPHKRFLAEFNTVHWHR